MDHVENSLLRVSIDALASSYAPPVVVVCVALPPSIINELFLTLQSLRVACLANVGADTSTLQQGLQLSLCLFGLALSRSVTNGERDTCTKIFDLGLGHERMVRLLQEMFFEVMFPARSRIHHEWEEGTTITVAFLRSHKQVRIACRTPPPIDP